MRAKLQVYDRQIRLPGWGVEGQLKVLREEPLLLGAGAVGNFVALELAELGVRRITVVDCDQIETVNLNRTPCFTYQDVGRLKAEVLAARLQDKNPYLQSTSVATRVEELDPKVWEAHSFIFSCLDNWESRRYVNAWAVALRKPMIDCGTNGFLGRVQFFAQSGEGPCLECNPFWRNTGTRRRGNPYALLKASAKKRKNITPTITMTSGLVASVAVAEFAKWSIGLGRSLDNSLFIDLQNSGFLFERLARNPTCPICSALREA